MKTGTMKNLTVYVSAFILAWTGCKKEINEQLPNNGSKNETKNINYPGVPCGKTYTTQLKTTLKDTSGTMSVYNDSLNLYVTFKATPPRLLQRTALYIGACNGIQRDADGVPLISTFPYSQTHTPEVASYAYIIPLNSIKDSCVCILGYAQMKTSTVELAAAGIVESWANIGDDGSIVPFNYCKQACPKKINPADTCSIKPGDFRTQTQGGWGTNPHGNNPGTYLHKNFAGAFPNGLTVGCTYTIKLTTAQAVTNYLPGGGPAAALSQNYIDPPNLKNVLASQVITLTLSLGFDKYDPNFGASKVWLGNLIVASGTFKGFTVKTVLDEANKALGGCPSNYSLSQLNDVISSINENFVDGKSSGGFLKKCDGIVIPQ